MSKFVEGSCLRHGANIRTFVTATESSPLLVRTGQPVTPVTAAPTVNTSSHCSLTTFLAYLLDTATRPDDGILLMTRKCPRIS